MSDEKPFGRDDGGTAFPVLVQLETFDDFVGVYRKHWEPTGGMSLRDYFAAKAMQAMVVGAPVPDLKPFERMEQGVARLSYVMADAMLEARK